MKLKITIAVILLFVSISAQAAKQNLPEQVIPECFGANIHFSGDDDKQVKQIADAGFRFIRTDMFWCNVEREKGKYDFSEYDGLMAALDRHGVRPLFILCYGNGIYSWSSDDKVAPNNDNYRQAFVNYARAAAAHYRGRGVIWELWNEPNLDIFWRPKPNAEHYSLMANAAAKAVREADPDATIIGPGVSHIDMGFIEQTMKLGILEHLDAVSMHPYREAKKSPETVMPEYDKLRQAINTYAPKGKQISLVSGEWGYSSVEMSAEQQAEYLIRMFLTNMMCGVKLSIWYDWRDDGVSKAKWDNCGTVFNDFRPKPAYHALQAATRQLGGLRFSHRAATGSENDYILVFTDGKSNKLAAWTTVEPHEITLATADVPAVVISDMYGSRRKCDIKNSTLKLQLSQSVSYVSCPYSGKALDLK